MELTLTPDMMLVLGLVGFTVIMLILEWVRADVVALLVLVVIGITGLTPVDQLFDGFASNAVLALMGVMIMGAGLDRTGVFAQMAAFILRMAGGVESRVSLIINTMAGSLSSIIQSQALATLFLPIASRISARTGIPLKRLLLPMAACILCGTSMTLISNSPLILLNDLIASADRNLPPGAQTIQPYSLFSITPIGIPLLLVGLAYFALFTRRLLPDEVESKPKVTPGRTESYFADTYGIEGEVIELTVTADSPLVGMSIREAEMLENAPLILAIKTGNDARLAPPGDQMIWVGTVLGVLGPRPRVNEFAHAMQCRAGNRIQALSDMFNPTRAGISEAVLPPSSRFIKQEVGGLRLRKRYGISVLAVNRGDHVFRGEDVRKVSLRAGDTLVLHSYWRDLALAAEDRDLVPVTDIPSEESRPGKVRHALVFFALAMGLGLFTDLKLSVAMLTGAVGMLLMGVLNMDEAYDAINWKTIFVMASLIPLGASMDSTGAAAWLAQELVAHTGHMPQWALQTLIAVLALLFSQVISHVGCVVMMVPMAINIALASGGNPSVYAILVALSVSNTFMIPGASPTILVVAGPGGYRQRDYLRIGSGLTVVMLVVTLVMVNVVFNH
jgi:di/tricarboxylate transporter